MRPEPEPCSEDEDPSLEDPTAPPEMEAARTPEKVSMFSGLRQRAAAAAEQAAAARVLLEEKKEAAEEAVWAKAAEAQAQAAAVADAARVRVAEAEAAAYEQAAAARKTWAGGKPSEASWAKLRLAVSSGRAVHMERRFEDAAMQGPMQKEGGRLSGWGVLYFVLMEGQLLAFNTRIDSAPPSIRLKVASLAVRKPQAERKGRPHVLRIDSTDDDVEKLVLDAGSQRALEEWMVALGNAGAVVPAAFISELDSRAATLARYTSTPRRRRIKKGWISIQPSSWWRLKHPTVSDWHQCWLQFEVPILTIHQRPGAEAIATIQMDQLELQTGPSVEESVGRDFSFRTTQRDTWEGEDPDWKKIADKNVIWTAMAADSQLDCELWVQALSTRKVILRRSLAQNFGLVLDDDATVLDLLAEPDGEPGPGTRAQVRKQQRIRRVNGIMVSSKAEVLELIVSDMRREQLVDQVEITFEGVGVPPIRADETEEEYDQRLRLEDEARLRKEVGAESESASKAEKELILQRKAEAAWRKVQLAEKAKLQIREAQEEHRYMRVASELCMQLTGSDPQTTELKVKLQSDRSRRIYHHGLLSKQNTQAKCTSMLQNRGRSYFYVFSDMLLLLEREGNGPYSFKLIEMHTHDRLKKITVTSHRFEAAEGERRGFTLAPLCLDRSKVAKRDYPYRLYAASLSEQELWVAALKQLLTKGWSSAHYGDHHERCLGTIFSASMQGDLMLVERALHLDLTCSVMKDEFGATPLHLAARYGHVDVVETLASRGNTFINAIDDEGRTPAHVAADGGHTDVLLSLGRHLANFNRPDNNDRVVLGILVANGSVSTAAAQRVAAAGAVVDRVDRNGRSGLHNAVALSTATRAAQVQMWIELGANVDKQAVDDSRATPLYIAATEIPDEQECVTVVNLLLQAGAHPNKPGNRHGETVLEALLDPQVGCEAVSAAHECVRAGADHRKILKGLTPQLQTEFNALASEYAAEQRLATVKRYAGKATAAITNAIEEHEIEPTNLRRNYLLSLKNGNVEEAVQMVSFRGILTDHLPNLTASAVPMVGVAYSVINPIWTQMRDVCLVAALYGHDIENDKHVQSLILECIIGEMNVQAEKQRERDENAKADGLANKLTNAITGNEEAVEQAIVSIGATAGQKVQDMAVKKAIEKLQTKIAERLAEKQASAFATCSGPVGTTLSYMYRAVNDRELAETLERAQEFFRCDAPGLSEEEWRVKVPFTWSRSIDRTEHAARELGSKVTGAIGHAIGAEHIAEQAGLMAASVASQVDDALSISERKEKALAAITTRKNELVNDVRDQTVNTLAVYGQNAVDKISKGIVTRIENHLAPPTFISLMIEELVEDVASGIKDETLGTVDQLLTACEKEEQMDEEAEANVNLGCCGKLRARILYIWSPYDHKIGWQIQDPWWIFLKLGPVIAPLVHPVGGCWLFMFQVLLFGLLDRSDEFQMVRFLIDFKGLQALAIGFGSLIAGAFSYAKCANTEPYSTCHEAGPGQSATAKLALLAWMASWALSCVVFLTLRQLRRKSAKKQAIIAVVIQTKRDAAAAQLRKQKERVVSLLVDAVESQRGDPRLMEVDLKSLCARAIEAGADPMDVANAVQAEPVEDVDERQRIELRRLELPELRQRAATLGVAPAEVERAIREGHGDPAARQGGAVKRWLQNLMIYDVVIFACAIGLAALSELFGSSFFLHAFWCKALYGVLAFPWLPTMLPVVDMVLAGADATGYTPKGRTVKKKKADPTPEEPEEVQRRRIVNLILSLEGFDEIERGPLMALELVELKRRAADAGVDRILIEAQGGATYTAMALRQMKSDQVLPKILDDMLQIAVSGGNLPINRWAEQLAPVFQASADAIKLRTDRIRTAAEKRDVGANEMPEGLTYRDQASWKAERARQWAGAWREGAMDVARDEAATQAKVLLAGHARELATQSAILVGAALELPKAVNDAIQDIIMSFVPDIAQTLNEGIDEWLTSAQVVEPVTSPRFADCKTPDQPWSKWRAALLYAYMPFDARSPAGDQQGRACNPTWWRWSTVLKFFTANSIIGTSYISMWIYYYLIDKTSQYQLVVYITHLKTKIVICTGLLMTAVGVVNYMSCVDMTSAKQTNEHAACDDSIVATYPLFWPVILLWLISNALIWLAMHRLLAMHRANQCMEATPSVGKSKNSSIDLKLRLERSQVLHSRTRFWRNYDLLTFLFSAAVGAIIIWQGSVIEDLSINYATSASGTLVDEKRLWPLGLYGEWELRQVVFWCHILHSLLSLPFLVFSLPLCHLVFTSEPVTGYTREGHCVALVKAQTHGDQRVALRSGRLTPAAGDDKYDANP